MGDESELPVEAEDPRTALDMVLAAHPDAWVAAIGTNGLVPVPESLQVGSSSELERSSALDLVIAEDQPLVMEGWNRAKTEQVVRMDVRLLADPGRPAPAYFLDFVTEHECHLVVLAAHDPASVLASAELAAIRGRRVAHVRRDAVSTFLEVDDATSELLGWTSDELIGRQTVEIVHPDDMEGAVEAWASMRSGSAGVSKVRLRHADGRYIWLEVTNDNRLDDPELQCVMSEMVDISEEMSKLEALHEREHLLHRLAEALPIGMCHLRIEGEVVYSNDRLVGLLGQIDSVEALVESVAEADRRLVANAVERALGGIDLDLEVGVIHGFEELRCELTLRVMRDDDGRLDGVIICVADVTDRTRLRIELEHRATHDALSGCLNRAAIVTALERALREARQVSVAYIDLDGFKTINDDLGHAAGDELLRVVAARLRSATRAEDRIGRIGGDEFVVISPHGGDELAIEKFVTRLSESVCGDVTFAKQRISLSASIGAVASREGEYDAEALLSRADAAMYEAKRQARRDASVLSIVRDVPGS